MITAAVVNEVFGILLVFARIGSAFMVMPGIGEPYVLGRCRLLLALACSLILAVPLTSDLPPPPAEPLAGLRLIAGEIAIGLFLGLAARTLFAALHLAGSVIAFQSGLAAAAIFDPNEATQGTLPGNLLTTVGLVLLFVTDAHHLLLEALAASYTGLPAAGTLPIGDMAELLSRFLDQAFATAVKIAAPLILISLLTYLVMGVLNRLMPAFQVLFVAMPLQILLTFATLALSLAGGLLVFFVLFEQGVQALVFGA